MPLGILDDTKLEHVPGTAPLSEVGHVPFAENLENASLLKHDPTGTIVLVPQPSDSPNDPYNWPRRKKELFTLAFAWGCGCVGAVGPLLGPAFVPLSIEFNVSLQTFAAATNGGPIVAIAAGSLLWNTLAVKYGKRPFYLLTTLGLMVTCFWCAAAKSFISLVAARVIMGLCMAPMEALIPASISDVWFVHERGFRAAIFNLGILGGINVGQPISGTIIQYSSYRTAFYAMGGAFAIHLLLIIFFMPETAFVRSGAVNIDTGVKDLVIDLGDLEKKKMEAQHIDEKANQGPEVVAIPTSEVPGEEPKKSWSKELLPYSGYNHHIPFLRTMFGPMWMLVSPPVLWATLLFTTSFSWLVGLASTLSQLFSAPPYNFSVGAVGATNLSSFVASCLGTLVAGPAVDGLVRRMAQRNGGIFEPEFRLPIIATYLLFTATGFFVWGYSISQGEAWPVPVVVGLGFINFGIQLGTTGVVAYVVDCHRERSSEAFGAMNFVKNMFSFGLTQYINNWIVTQGVQNVFFTIGGITAFVSLLTVPMYVFGKRARSWARRHNVEGKA